MDQEGQRVEEDEEEEQERGGRCIRLDRLSRREPAAHPEALNWPDPQC